MYFSDNPLLSSVLVGREREMDLLERALAAAQERMGQCLILAGEAGIGKSCLVAELGLSATARGFLTLSGQCFEQDLSFPFAPFIDMLRLFCSRRSAAEVQPILERRPCRGCRAIPACWPIYCSCAHQR